MFNFIQTRPVTSAKKFWKVAHWLPNPNPNLQEDAAEFKISVMNKMKLETNEEFIDSIFSLYCTKVIRCTNCFQKKVNAPEDYPPNFAYSKNLLKLMDIAPYKLESLIINAFTGLLMKKVICENCKKENKYVSYLRPQRVPLYLVIELKLMSFSKTLNVSRKINVPNDIPIYFFFPEDVYRTDYKCCFKQLPCFSETNENLKRPSRENFFNVLMEEDYKDSLENSKLIINTRVAVYSLRAIIFHKGPSLHLCI